MLRTNRKTQIVATISDLRSSHDYISQLSKAGMNIIRLNTAHQSLTSTAETVKRIRSVSAELPIMIDTKGPEIRTCKMESPKYVKENDLVLICNKDSGIVREDAVDVSYSNLVQETPVGTSILIDDGEVEVRVEKKEQIGDQTVLVCRVLNDGKIGSRQSLNIPSITLALPALSAIDIQYIEFAVKHNIEYLAHSFVRSGGDVMQIKEAIAKHNGYTPKIIAKIEDRAGVRNIEEIVDLVDGVIVARGDLGNEILLEELPMAQKHILKVCNRKGKVGMVATQMIHSMCEHPRPTRAEVSDIANAVLDGAGALFLSGETTHGKYPVKAVETMSRIITYTEEYSTKVL